MKEAPTDDVVGVAPDSPQTWWRSPQGTLCVIWFCAIIGIFFVIASALYALRLIDDEQVKESSASLSSLTRVTEEHAFRTFRAADQALQFVASRYAVEGNRLDLPAMVAKGGLDVDFYTQVGVIDAQGIFQLSTRPFPKGLVLSDREHFSVHRSSALNFLFISKPVLGRATGEQSIQLTRSIRNPAGGLLGVGVVSINVDYFTRFYQDLKLPRNSVSSLLGVDGVTRAQTIGGATLAPETLPLPLLTALLSEGKTSGVELIKSESDGTERLMAYRKVTGFPLIVTNSVDLKIVRSQNKDSRTTVFLFSALLILCAFGTAKVAGSKVTQLQAKNAQLKVLFDLSLDAYVSFDQDFRVKYCNVGFERISGLRLQNVVNLTESEFVKKVDSRCERDRLLGDLAMLRDKAASGERQGRKLIQFIHSGKRLFEVQLKIKTSTPKSQILYMRDVTHETAVEDMKSEFLATAAHELRTPMACILGFAEVMLNQPFDDSQRREFLTIILQQSKQMEVILNDLLDLAKIEARRSHDYLLVPVNIRKLSGDLVNSFSLPPQRDRPEMSVPNMYLNLDVGKASQAILNVLNNAYKYSTPGSMVKIYGAAPIASKTGTLAGLCIEDQGLGIARQDLTRVFERFFRVDTSGQRQGTGLGMSIVKELMDGHGGQVLLKSTLGQGTVVTLLFPMVNVVEQALPAVEVVAG